MRAWLEIDLEQLAANCQLVRRQIGREVGLIAVVKNDAYGHGIERVVKTLDQAGSEMFAVISLEEARAVRRVSKRAVLILGYLDSREIGEAVEEGYVLSLYDRELCPIIQRAAERLKKKVRVHLKVETGLNRLGVSAEDATSLLLNQHHFPNIHIEAVYSHLAEPANQEKSQAQLRVLQQLILATQDKIDVLPFHLASSRAIPDFKEGYLDAVRVGLTLYGYEPILSGIEPIACCRTTIAQVKRVPEGEAIGYDGQYQTTRPTDVAILPIGYGEGLTSALAKKGQVLVHGHRCPILGVISMNLTAIDVSGLNAKRGEDAVLIGSQRTPSGRIETILVTELAQWSNLRHHEIITRLGSGLPKIYVGG